MPEMSPLACHHHQLQWEAEKTQSLSKSCLGHDFSLDEGCPSEEMLGTHSAFIWARQNYGWLQTGAREIQIGIETQDFNRLKNPLKVPRVAGGCGVFISAVSLKEMHKCPGEVLGLRISRVGIFQAERKILSLILFSEWWVGVQGAAAPKGFKGFLYLDKMLQENWSHPLKTGN